MAVVCRGYELEADAMTRVLLELFIAAREALADPTGDKAERWMKRGMGKGIGTRVDAAVPHTTGVYRSLSRASHGDLRAVLGLAEGVGDDQAVEWGPRTTPRTAAILRSYAVGARDFAVLIEEVTDRQHDEVSRLDIALSTNVDGFESDKKWPEEMAD
jgi:hypothetical protein